MRFFYFIRKNYEKLVKQEYTGITATSQPPDLNTSRLHLGT